MTKSLLELPEFHETLKFLSGIPYINHGGCGVSALAIVRWLRARDYPIKRTPFVVRMNSRWGLQENKEAIRANKPLFRAPHIVVSVGNALYDCTGNVTKEPYWVAHLRITEELLVLSLNDKGWNSKFVRATWVPCIEEELNIDLSDVNIF